MRKPVLALLLLCVLGGVVYSYTPARITALVLLGRSPVCPFQNAIQAPRDLARQIQIKDRILASSRSIQADPQGFELWETPKGRFWVPKGSQYVLPFNLAEQERRIYEQGEVRIKPGDTVLDCGANIGVYTRLALEQGAVLVVAIEPAPENLECLRRNFAAEIEAKKVIVYPKGVWDKDDMLTLHVDPYNSAADSFLIQPAGSHPAEKVPLTTIDKLVRELNLTTVNFIKMDIEGAEVKALQGAKGTMAKFHSRIAVSVYHAPEHPVEVPRVIGDAWSGYRMSCGPCAEIQFGIRPDILYFY